MTTNTLYNAIHAAAQKITSAQKIVTEYTVRAFDGDSEAIVEFQNALYQIDTEFADDKSQRKIHTDVLRMQLRRASLAIRKGTELEGVSATVKKVDGKYLFIAKVQPKPTAGPDVSKAVQTVLDNLDDESVREALTNALLAYEAA